jgi:methionyl-tRNA synthetase
MMQNKKPYYISTAIAYASAIPHIGNVYEAILADAIARFKRLDGYDVYFQTGTDEHGLKIETKANEKNLDPQTYVDQISNEIKRIYGLVDISYDKFIRTTDAHHKHSVQRIFDKLLAQDDIYLGTYQGWYSVSEESYIQEKDIVDGKGPQGDTLVWTEEEVYFFRMSKYQEKLLQHIQENPTFISPESRKNEMIQNFLSESLPDLSISRTSFKWGIPVQNNTNHVIYVWMDALSNYITGLGYHPDTSSNEMDRFWPADVHLIGKDILRFHTIYWPIFLMALDLPLPKQVFGHPWILVNKGKMSKSVGNVMYVDDLLTHFKKDVIRYYVLHEIPYAQDGNMTYELIIERNNSDLANTIGNLVNRSIGMAMKYREGHITYQSSTLESSKALKNSALGALDKMRTLMDDLKVADALEVVVELARQANKYIDLTEPFKVFKEDAQSKMIDEILYHLIEVSRFIGVLLTPFIPETSARILALVQSTKDTFDSLQSFDGTHSIQLSKPEVLFERFDFDKKLEEIIG